MLRLVLIFAALVLFTGCQQPRSKSKQTVTKAPVEPPMPVFRTNSPPPAVPATQSTNDLPLAISESDKVTYDPVYDSEIKEVFRLAGHNQWEEARIKAAGLLQFDPTNTMLQRLNTWVLQQSKRLREQALEDEIRNIDAQNNATYNPSAMDVLTEKEGRGLPARKDVRDAVDLIESSPWIPKNFGKTIREKGPLFDFEAAKGPMGKVLEKEVSIHLDNVPFETVILNLSQSSGVNIIADKTLPALTNRLTINLDNVKLGEFFKYVGRNYGVQFQVGQDLVWMIDASSTNRLMEEVRFYKLRKGFVLPAAFGAEDVTRSQVTAGQVVTVTENQKFRKFVNDEAPAMPAIERAITNLFTGSKYMIDYERNLIVARGSIEQLDVLENIIKEFDQPIQQVLIEARFVTLSKPAFLQLGVLWETGRLQANAATVAAGGSVPQGLSGLLPESQAPNLGLGIQYMFTNILDQAQLTATISALEQSGESQTLSAPRLTVINNRPASISDGKVQYYYEEYTVKQTIGQYFTASSLVPSGKPTKITSGAELNVMASISGDGRHILLALNPSVKTDVQLVDYATIQQSISNNVDLVIKLPQYRTQEMATRTVIKSGETVAMGGVLERQTTELVESVPILGSIPYIGSLFRRRTAVDTPRYLLVFVTATIINDSGDGVVFDDAVDSNHSR
ncbi:MAG TPA: type II secretion system protein GspD [Verrucomicrobiae bacterium]|nr:type II secretion system protein GspD [Verrucomicrobiae bacterium]